MSIDSQPTCPIISRFAEDLKLNGKSPRTGQSYCRALRKFTEYLGHAPDLATEDQLRKYLLFVVEKKTWAGSTVNVTLQALKLFYRITCPREWHSLKLARVRVEQKLPVVLSISEVHTLLKLIEKPSMHCYFSVVYAMGLRLNEALHLHVSDVDSKRMLVHVHRGKGAKDRLVPLPHSTLQLMRQYWSTHRNPLWIFPAEGRNHKLASTADSPMSESSVQGVIKAVLNQLNWSKRGISTHTLRHCYATHLLEGGVSLKLIQKYMGHAHLTSTMICPTCQGSKAKSWLAEQQARLLPCAYFMLTFTVPAEFRAFMRSHPRECYPAIFQAAYQSLIQLARDPKYIGSDRLGMTGVLHTWGRDLNYHPHVHFIVPGGALSSSGTDWLSSRIDFLVPVLALSKIYRAKFKELMNSCGLLASIDSDVWSRPWNVNCQAGFQSLGSQCWSP